MFSTQFQISKLQFHFSIFTRKYTCITKTHKTLSTDPFQNCLHSKNTPNLFSTNGQVGCGCGVGYPFAACRGKVVGGRCGWALRTEQSRGGSRTEQDRGMQTNGAEQGSRCRSYCRQLAGAVVPSFYGAPRCCAVVLPSLPWLASLSAVLPAVVLLCRPATAVYRVLSYVQLSTDASTGFLLRSLGQKKAPSHSLGRRVQILE